MAASPIRADSGPIAGIDLGAGVPLATLQDRTDAGGVFSLFGGYMFIDYLGLAGQLQVLALPTDDVPGLADDDVAAQLAFTVGPRLEFPVRDSSRPESWNRAPVFYLTGQPGVFTGIAGHALSGTAFGVTGGGGVNFRLNDSLLLGPFVRYNWVDQRVTGENGELGGVRYLTTGISLTYNPARPPPLVAAAAPATRAPSPPMKKKIVLRGVNFDFDKSVIRSDARPVLDQAIATLRQEGNVTIVAEGHTDSRGTDAYNQALSLRRARAVREYLVAGGIGASRIQVEGFGESRPVATNETDDGRAQNRRVELRVVSE